MPVTLGEKGKQLIDLYATMARDGYRTVDNQTVYLLCSTGWRQAKGFEIWSANDLLTSPTFVTNN